MYIYQQKYKTDKEAKAMTSTGVVNKMNVPKKQIGFKVSHKNLIQN